MTVKQLIEALQSYPEDKVVVNQHSAEEVELVEEVDDHYFYLADDPSSVVLIT